MPTSISNSLRSRHHVTAILVAHNGATWLPEVVASLTKQRHEIDQVIAVDTGSKDDSARLLKNAGITTLSAPRETGFGEAVEIALASTKLKRAAEGITEWIWLIHDDCAPQAEALRELLLAIDEKPNVALAGPKLRGWYDRNHLLEVGVSIAGNGARWTGLEYREQDQGQHDGITEVLSVSTAGALIRREVFEEIGGFDKELSLFRDDVDLGWRIHTAGHTALVVPTAVAFHAEAAANERREIDVTDAFLHRPLLLDRRHAAYVLLANSTFWLLPLIALQLLGAALLRSIGYLLAKLPGYALDELAAVALVILQPQDLIRGRRARKTTRLVSSRVVARFVPPRGTQLALTIDKSRDALLRTWRATSLVKRAESTKSSSIDFNDEAAENADIELVKAPSIFSGIKSRPILSSFIALFIVSLIAFRGRYTDLVGGAMPLTPDSGLNLLRQYVDSWHIVGLGSSVNMPPWIAILGTATLITGFNAKLFISLLFVLAVPLAFIGAYLLAKKFTNLPYLALGAALLYSFAPLGLTSLNAGRLATVLLFVVGPWLVRALLDLEILESLSWRKVWWLAILLTVVFAFSPLTFGAIVIWQFLLVVFDVFAFNAKPGRLSKEDFDSRNIRRIAIVVAPILVTAPWSLELILHPSRILLDPGLPLPGGDVLSIILTNPGGVGAPPIWLVPSILFISIIALFVSQTARLGEVALFFIGLAAIFGSRQVAGHGQYIPEPLWVGSLLVIPILAAVLAGVVMVDQYLPKLSESAIDYRHLLLGSTSLLSIISLLASMVWWIGSAASAPLQTKERSALPAFLSVEAQTDERFKTLVINSSQTETRFFVARERDLYLGEPDITTGLSPVVNKSIINLVTGAGIDSSQIMAEFGIKYVFLARPFNKDLVRTIDGVGGFTRASRTAEGITWKVAGALAHISFLSIDGTYLALPSGPVGASGTLPSSGTVIITEKFDSRWKLLLNGRAIDAQETDSGVLRFVIPESGEFIIYHDGTARRGWVSLQFIAMTTLIVLALPARRRRSEMTPEELA
ncbi:MAG: glycosyltransferase [Actinobacteria bacterium]|nr:glycosyltransferase [Actinomycetota bacterium]NCV43208.1 glycosyltransferase [Actinomycetota bacterium]NCV95418.1 glycosyltransferase [Actinomycetota bacterium]NCX00455.1 glycosyltransferase [Actinomycetota bacterium]NDE95507.1 glycosyltransferase [Actinomycetota bacterium]